MKKRYEINPINKSTIEKLNKLKTLLKISTTGALLEFLASNYLEKNKDELIKKLFKKGA